VEAVRKAVPEMKLRAFAVMCFGLAALPLMQSQTHNHALTETLGTVTFANSCSPSVQPNFNRAVGTDALFSVWSSNTGLQCSS
jgi:hypothetical protein